MSAADMRTAIEKLVTELVRLRIVLDANISVIANSGWLTWANSVSPSFSSTTLGEYQRLIAGRQYTCLLRDGSFLQISAMFDGQRLIRHRYCFFPCPLTLDLGEDLTISEHIELLSDAELLERLRLDGPIRFDFDAVAACEGHPASHLTALRSSCRVPVFAPLSVGHFVRFVFANFYPDLWEAHELLRTWPIEWHHRTITASE